MHTQALQDGFDSAKAQVDSQARPLDGEGRPWQPILVGYASVLHAASLRRRRAAVAAWLWQQTNTP